MEGKKQKIIVTHGMDCFRAELEGRPEITGSGKTSNEAVGDLVSSHFYEGGLNIEVVTDPVLVEIK